MTTLPERHPQNTSFSWSPAPGGGRLSADELQQFDRDGYVLVENAFSSEEVAELTAAIDPIEHEVESFLKTLEDGRAYIARAGEITFAPHLVAKHRAMKDASASSPILDLCLDLIGPDVRLYWDQAVYKKPGNPEEFPFHQDNGYTFLEPQQYLTCWVALTDTDESNGCPWVIPGWHQHGTFEHANTELGQQCIDTSSDALPVPAAAGDIVVFSSLTPHRTGPNLTDHTRKSYILQYAPDGARCLGGPTDTGLQDHPDRQYMVLANGSPVPIP